MNGECGRAGPDLCRTETLARLRDDPKPPELGRTYLQEKTAVKKEREAKDDGRYIIFYTFESEEEEPHEAERGEGD